METILQNVFFFLFGLTFCAYIYKSGRVRQLVSKMEKLQKEYEDFLDNGMSQENKQKMDSLETKLSEKETIIDNLKKYMGLVGDKEYGFIDYRLVKTINEAEIKLKFRCGFKVTQRGQNKVRISIDKNDVKCGNSHYDSKNDSDRVKELIDGWYDIDHKGITWIEPDEAMKRDITLDKILSTPNLNNDEE